ncbi:MAG: metal-dependent hydrolase [Candidatus Bathyarchaeia archaeon]
MQPLLHFTVPFVAATLLGLKPKKAFVVSLFALVPDLDVLFHVHRSMSHSLLMLLLISVPFILWTKNSKFHEYALLGSVMVGSHLVFDLFTNYTPILWPLYGNSLWVAIEGFTHVGSYPTIDLGVRVLTAPVSFAQLQSFDAQLFTGEGFIASAFLLALSFSKIILKGLRKSA